MFDLNKIYGDNVAIIGYKKDIQKVCDFLHSKGFKIGNHKANEYPYKVWYGCTLDYDQKSTMICFCPKTGYADGQRFPSLHYLKEEHFIENNSYIEKGYKVYTVDELYLNNKDK